LLLYAFVAQTSCITFDCCNQLGAQERTSHENVLIRAYMKLLGAHVEVLRAHVI